VWLGEPPAGWTTTHRLQLAIQAFEAVPARDAVRLQARWTIQRTDGQPPLLAQADLRAPSTGPDTAALVQAHRVALWRLAAAIAGSATV